MKNGWRQKFLVCTLEGAEVTQWSFERTKLCSGVILTCEWSTVTRWNYLSELTLTYTVHYREQVSWKALQWCHIDLLYRSGWSAIIRRSAVYRLATGWTRGCWRWRTRCTWAFLWGETEYWYLEFHILFCSSGVKKVFFAQNEHFFTITYSQFCSQIAIGLAVYFTAEKR